MSSPPSAFATKFRQLDFVIDGDFERNCDFLLAILSAFETAKLEDVDDVRLAIRLHNYSSWLLYRYARPCCARVLCHNAIYLLEAFIRRLDSPYLYLLLLDELVNVGRLDRAVQAWISAANLFSEIAGALRGGWISPRGLEPIRLPDSVADYLDAHVLNWASDWWTRAVHEVIKTFMAAHQFAPLLDALDGLERISLPVSRAAVYRGRAEAYIGLRAFAKAFKWHVEAVNADRGEQETPEDDIRLMHIYSGMQMENELVEVAQELDKHMMPLIEAPYRMASCDAFLTVAEACYKVGMHERGEAYLAACIRRCELLNCQRVMGRGLTLALCRAVERVPLERVSNLCQQLSEFMSDTGYLHLRPEAYRAIGQGLDVLGHKLEAEAYRVGAEIWQRKLLRILCDTGGCSRKAVELHWPSSFGTRPELDEKVTGIFKRIALATREKLIALSC